MTSLLLQDEAVYILVQDEGHVSVLVQDDVSILISETGTQGVAGPARESYPFTAQGELYVVTGPNYLPFDADYSFESWIMAVDIAPDGDDIIVDLLINDVTIFADPDDRPVILDGQQVSTVTTADVEVEAGDRLSVNIEQVGSVFAGEFLTGMARWLKL